MKPPPLVLGLRLLPISVLAVGLATALGCGDPPRRFTEPMMLGGRRVEPEVLERGARAYGLYCVSCHGVDGSGRGNGSRSLDNPPRDFREGVFKHVSGPPGSLPTDSELGATILNGLPGTGMPPWNGLAPEELDAVIQYLKTFSPRWQEVPPA